MQTLKTRAIAILGTLVTGAASLTLAAPAHADLPKARVSYADLDVHSKSGQRVLSGRINHAVGQVCDDSQTDDRFALASCRAQALDHAYADLQSRGVTIR